MHTASVCGVKTSYEIYGKGTPLILLHGWANTGEAWSYLITALSSSYMCIVPDLPGFGQTETPNKEFWTTEDYADWLEQFIHKVLEKKKFYIAGHSFGGQVSLCYTQSTRSPQPAKLILISSSGLKREKTLKGKVLGEMTKLLPHHLKKKLPRSIKKLVYEKILTETDYFNGNQFQKNVLKHILIQDYTKGLPKIGMPTLIVQGVDDVAVPMKHAQLLHSLIPNNELLICSDSGHFPHITETPKVAATIERFLHT